MRCCCSEIAAHHRFADASFTGREQDTLHVVPHDCLRERCNGYHRVTPTVKRKLSTDRLNFCILAPAHALENQYIMRSFGESSRQSSISRGCTAWYCDGCTVVPRCR